MVFLSVVVVVVLKFLELIIYVKTLSKKKLLMVLPTETVFALTFDPVGLPDL